MNRPATGKDAPGAGDCWNRIGVRGDGSCPELRQHVHCRNCPVFADAAAGLLDRAAPPEARAEWTRNVAAPPPARETDTHAAVIFRIGPEWLALSAGLFEEVVDPRPIHSLPNQRSDVVLGVANIRGELRVCVSLAKLLRIEMPAEGRGARARAGYPRLLVVKREGSRVAAPVDEVHGVQRYRPQALRELPATVAQAAPVYTRAILDWERRSVGVLDDQLLFYSIDRSLA